MDPVAEVERRLMERLAAQDPDADAAVGAQANTAISSSTGRPAISR
ncbi:hypothetical protein GS416_10360 [Rhodococcus hoagii]|nr:hypothetical protein [Prescottella equi]